MVLGALSSWPRAEGRRRTSASATRTIRDAFPMGSTAQSVRLDVAALRGSLDPRAGLHVLRGRERRDDAVDLRREDHAVALQPADLARRQVRDHDDLLPDELLGLDVLAQAREDLALLDAQVHLEDPDLVGLGVRLAGDHL